MSCPSVGRTLRPCRRPSLCLLLLLVFLLLSLVALVVRLRTPPSEHRLSANTSQAVRRHHFYDSDHSFNLRFTSNSDSTDSSADSPSCRLSTCLDIGRCSSSSPLRIHIYPWIDSSSAETNWSPLFASIVEIISKSVYFESNPNKACLFLNTVWDTLDRDPLSADFQKPSAVMTTSQPLLGGRNHLVFNLYSGSWPEYRELDFQFSDPNYGNGIQEILAKGIRVKTSQSESLFRPLFDISFPLFPRDHPLHGPPVRPPLPPTPPAPPTRFIGRRRRRQHLLVFKGKRYVYGIGSETRNSLHFLREDEDVRILTTCRHGKRWQDLKDDKCDEDDAQYAAHDFQTLMRNATFCLVPRGRRLSSFRFLESLAVGCIPVLLSNEYVLPFADVIDWSSCVVRGDERLLLQIPETLRQFSDNHVLRMRRHCRHLYDQFFSSVDRIVFTALSSIESRLLPHSRFPDFVLNADTLSTQFLTTQWLFGNRNLNPTLYSSRRLYSNETLRIVAVVSVDSNRDSPALSRLLYRTIIPLLSSETIAEIAIVLPEKGVSLPPLVVHSSRIRLHRNVSSFAAVVPDDDDNNTDAVLYLSSQSLLTKEEIQFAVGVWRSFPERVVGFEARNHFYSSAKQRFEVSNRWTNRFSWVSSDGSIVPMAVLRASVDSSSSECQSLSLAFISSHFSRLAPLKVGQRKHVTNSSNDRSFSALSARRDCFDGLIRSYGYIPFIGSRLRLDPLLFLDSVDKRRKKYLQMESI